MCVCFAVAVVLVILAMECVSCCGGQARRSKHCGGQARRGECYLVAPELDLDEPGQRGNPYALSECDPDIKVCPSCGARCGRSPHSCGPAPCHAGAPAPCGPPGGPPLGGAPDLAACDVACGWRPPACAGWPAPRWPGCARVGYAPALELGAPLYDYLAPP